MKHLENLAQKGEFETMHNDIDVLTVWLPLIVNLCTFLGICVTVFLLAWRFQSKVDLDRSIDKLGKHIGSRIAKLTITINHGFSATLAVTNEICEEMRQMRSGIQRLSNKIDANSQAIHVDTRKLTEQLNNVASDLRAEIREQTSGNTEDA